MQIISRKIALAAGLIFTLVISAAVKAQNNPPGYMEILPDQIKWTQSASIPPGGQVALMVGSPGQPGPFIARVKLPADYKIQPHTHPDERVYTVISGTFYVGFGDKFNSENLKALSAGSLFVLPANVSHYHWMKSGEAVVQISSIGPSATDYINHADDPRKK